ncbi:MAG: ATP-binding protein [Clostridia bacterium]|nr:ATP-binding protein [Clostridia bacterium]
MSYNTMAEQLETLDQSRNQFVSNASHELKTPLTTMKILLESLIYQPDMPVEMRTDFMTDMNHEIDRLTRIITDLLTLTKTDDHQLTLNLKETDLSALTRETVRMLQPMAEQRGQTMTVKAEDTIVSLCDPERIRQVFNNLTDNAVKYTPDGGHITVSLRKSGRNILWQVEDDGPGIPEKDRSRVFERFYRVDKARSRNTGGTGLGLSIVKQMVSLHGGTV